MTTPPLLLRTIDKKYVAKCCNAIESAASRLGIDPSVLAERLKDGGIAELVEAAGDYMRCPEHADAERGITVLDKLESALTPFTKE